MADWINAFSAAALASSSFIALAHRFCSRKDLFVFFGIIIKGVCRSSLQSKAVVVVIEAAAAAASSVNSRSTAAAAAGGFLLFLLLLFLRPNNEKATVVVGRTLLLGALSLSFLPTVMAFGFI